jgi:hypothetical protein
VHSEGEGCEKVGDNPPEGRQQTAARGALNIVSEERKRRLMQRAKEMTAPRIELRTLSEH